MFAGPSVDRHHLIPKSEGGTEAVWMHRSCHKKLHSLFDERTLAKVYNSFEALRENEDVRRFVTWVRKQPPEAIERHRRPRKRR